MDLFDIIGPIMIGPSSSHTAGAARIGRITRMLLGSEPKEVQIGLWGSFQKTYQGHGTDKALIGGLMGMDVDDLRLRDSLSLAKAEGVHYSFYPATLRGAHPNTVLLDVIGADGRKISVKAASIGGGEILIQSIDGMEADFSGHENTLVITHHDTPGMIAAMTGAIAQNHVNIATMQVFRQSMGGEALVALELDSPASPALLHQLYGLTGVYHVSYIAGRSAGTCRGEED